MSNKLIEDVAAAVAAVAVAEVLPRWRHLGAGDVVEKTGPEDLVTVADKAAETALSERLLELLPGSLVVGEEAVAADPSVLRRFGGPGPVWVIDPIDGTSAFAAGEPGFTIMVALVEAGRPVAGWIHAPALGQMVCGGVDFGVFEQRQGGERVAMSAAPAPTALADMIGLLGRRNITEARRAELVAKAQHFKALDGVTYAGIDYVRLLRGEAHFALYSKSEPWDHLPGLAILSARGFSASKFDGTPYRPGDNSGGLLVAPGPQALSRIRQTLLA